MYYQRACKFIHHSNVVMVMVLIVQQSELSESSEKGREPTACSLQPQIEASYETLFKRQVRDPSPASLTEPHPSEQ